MKALPSIDLENGQAVKRVRGERGTGLRLGDPLEIAHRAADAGFTRLHIVDLDGAERGEPSPRNLGVVEAIWVETGLSMQFGGGIRSSEAAHAACEARGVDTLVIGTAWLRDPRFLDRVAGETGCRVAAALEVKGGRVAVSGWRQTLDLTPSQALDRLSETNAWGVLLTIVDVEGMMRGVVEEVRSLVSLAREKLGRGRALEYSGGVASMRDLEELEAMGVDYVVLGMALHTGALDWREVARRYG